MKVSNLSILSALVASLCCLGPFLLIILGLGSLGINVVIGKYHWHLIATGIILVTLSWCRYFKERKICSFKGCQMINKKVTLVALTISTLIVSTFVGLNVYTYAIQKNYDKEKSIAALSKTETASIPVEGMTCFTCEFSVSSALKKLDGVVSVKASAKEGVAWVNYDSDIININQLIETINKTGYKAILPGGE